METYRLIKKALCRYYLDIDIFMYKKRCGFVDVRFFAKMKNGTMSRVYECTFKVDKVESLFGNEKIKLELTTISER